VPLRIDGHTHVLAPDSPFSVKRNGDPNLLLEMLDEAGLDRAVIFGIAPYDRNEYTAEVCARHPDRFIGFVSISPNDTVFSDYGTKTPVDRLVDALELYPFRGVKLHPRIQGFSISDPKHTPLFQKIAELGLPVLVDTISRGSQAPIADNLPFEIDRVLRRVPGLKVIMAHMGGHRVMDAHSVVIAHPHVYVDLSWVLHLYQGSSVERDIKWAVKQLAPMRRVIFGSDFPIHDRQHTLRVRETVDLCERLFDDIALDSDAVSAVMGGTMADLVAAK
jgi:predicted TIM-barrel fold metal-dependent hydrolase